MILVTGATGFIGREILARLRAAGRPATALVRGPSAAARLAAAVGDAAGAGLDVVEADLAAPRCGLAPAVWRRLAARVDTVIHCAGDASFAPRDLDRFVAGHVEGPVALLHGLAPGRLRRWLQFSTAFVCGLRAGTVGEDEGDVGQAFRNPYERVKLAAETAIREAGCRTGVAVTVLRPSIVVGAAPATAGGGPSGLFFGFLRLAAGLAGLARDGAGRLRIEGAPAAPFNIVPVAHVAAAAVGLAGLPAAAGETLHLVVPGAPSQAAMLGMITERLGGTGLELVDARAGGLPQATALERRVARMLEPYRAYLVHDVRFDDARAARLLALAGVPRPRLGRDEVRRLIDLALRGAPAAAATPP